MTYDTADRNNSVKNSITSFADKLNMDMRKDTAENILKNYHFCCSGVEELEMLALHDETSVNAGKALKKMKEYRTGVEKYLSELKK